ncbi:MAG: ABC transporter permease [Bacillota bacterium]
MTRYLARSLVGMAVVLVAATLITYLLIEAAPGDPVVALYAGNPDFTEADIARIRSMYGLDRPVLLRWASWCMGLVRGDMGYSRVYRLPVVRVVRQRLANSLVLMGVSLMVSVCVAVPLGVLTAVRRNSLVDHVVSLMAYVGMSAPVFWTGLMAIWLFSVRLGLLPAGGTGGSGGRSLAGWLIHLILPAAVLSFFTVAPWVRYMRSSMLEVLGQEYMVAARAKGLAERVVLFKHGLRNAILPIITLIGLGIPSVVGGAVVTETVFAWPGMGRLLYDSIISADYSVAMGCLLVLCTLVVVSNLLADIAYSLADPRVRLT